MTCTSPGIYFFQSKPDITARPFETFAGPDMRYEQNMFTLIVSGPENGIPSLPDLSLIKK